MLVLLLLKVEREGMKLAEGGNTFVPTASGARQMCHEKCPPPRIII